MTREDIIRMARVAGCHDNGEEFRFVEFRYLERFAALVAAAEREKVAAWMMQRGYATGHGDTIEDLLKELEWQVAEREREACAQLCERMARRTEDIRRAALEMAAENIRARGKDPMPLFDDWPGGIPYKSCPPCNHHCNQGRDCPNA